MSDKKRPGLAEHVATGLCLLWDRWTAGPVDWIKQGKDGQDKAIRVGMLAGAGLVLFSVLRSSWLLLVVAALLVVVRGMRLATVETRKKTPVQEAPAEAAEASEDTAERSADEQPVGPTPFGFLRLLHQELYDARAVHLSHLADRLSARYPERAWDVPAVAALCEAAGVPVNPKIRAHGKGATRGVERSALPPLPAPLSRGPVVDVDAAGQPPSTGSSTSTSTGSSTCPDERPRVDRSQGPIIIHMPGESRRYTV